MHVFVQASSTASRISCTSPKCSCGSPRCGCSTQQCTYTRSYAEQSSSSGILLEDVLALHDGELIVDLRPTARASKIAKEMNRYNLQGCPAPPSYSDVKPGRLARFLGSAPTACLGWGTAMHQVWSLFSPAAAV